MISKVDHFIEYFSKRILVDRFLIYVFDNQAVFLHPISEDVVTKDISP
jgi:hypothetical protein